MLAACATVDPGPDYDRAVREIRVATGVRDAYRPGEEEACAERVRELLNHGLELREAVEVALLNNPGLQGAFRTIGMARADRVQAGMLTNPSLMFALRFPTSGGGTAIEGNLLGNLLDVWQLSARVDAADAALQGRILEVAHGAVTLAGAVRSAYIDAVAAEHLLVIAGENRATAAQLFELAEERVAAQAATAVGANLARLDLATTELALRDAHLAVSEARRTLATQLGLEALPSDCALASDFADQQEALPSAERLNELAEQSRLDLRAAQRLVDQASAELDRERGRVARVLNLGAAAEKEDGDWSVGPALQLELPLFDQNQAQIAKAAETLELRRQVLAALRLTALQDVGSARERAQVSRDAVRLYSEHILVRSQEALELARESYRVGKTTILPVLEAQRSLLSARREHVQRQQLAATAISDLERATGMPRETLFAISPRKEP
ncbi:MAG: TolC family protein [Planctomycetota bacterium]|jgi:cobalt-zinc-cadmium efflux system outer membrane protein